MSVVKYIGVRNNQAASNKMSQFGDGFSVGNYVQDLVVLGSIKNSLEKSVSVGIEREQGTKAFGLLVPDNYWRDMTVGNDGTFLVGTNVSNMFYSALTAKSVCLQAGLPVINFAYGNGVIAGLATPANVSWVSENAVSDSVADPSFEAVTASPKMLSVEVNIGRMLMLQSKLEVDAIIKRELVRAIALELDRVVIQGTGTLQPLGLINAGITEDAVGEMTYANTIAMSAAIEDANANLNGLSMITNPTIKAAMQSSFRNPLSGDTPVWGAVDDMKYLASKNCPTQTAIIGDFSQAAALCTFGGGVDILVDKYSYSSSGKLKIVARIMVDLAIFHKASFRYTKSVTA